jgi:general secretion pathway protein G
VADLIGLILDIYLDVKHWFKVKKRRKFEKENNLPKKRMISPMNKIAIVFLIILTAFLFLKINSFKKQGKKITLNEMIKIRAILEAEKKQFGTYPTAIKDIIRNNPLRKNIALDYWKNEFIYLLSKDSLNYTLISLGKDRIQDTSDDLKVTN